MVILYFDVYNKVFMTCFKENLVSHPITAYLSMVVLYIFYAYNYFDKFD